MNAELVQDQLENAAISEIYRLLKINNIDKTGYYIQIFDDDIVIAEEIDRGPSYCSFSALLTRFEIELADPECFDKIVGWFKINKSK